MLYWTQSTNIPYIVSAIHKYFRMPPASSHSPAVVVSGFPLFYPGFRWVFYISFPRPYAQRAVRLDDNLAQRLYVREPLASCSHELFFLLIVGFPLHQIAIGPLFENRPPSVYKRSKSYRDLTGGAKQETITRANEGPSGLPPGAPTGNEQLMLISFFSFFLSTSHVSETCETFHYSLVSPVRNRVTHHDTQNMPVRYF